MVRVSVTRGIAMLPCGSLLGGAEMIRALPPAVLIPLLLMVPLRAGAAGGDDVLQKAVNYMFTGKVDPADAPQIVDRKACVVVVRDPDYKRYARYYLARFRFDDGSIVKKYSGSRVLYELDVVSDDAVVEYLSLDKTTVLHGYKSAQIPLPGNIEQTRRAFQLIFGQYCKPENSSNQF